jgi:hypothetical protein
VSLRPAERPSKEPASAGGCTRCTTREQELDRLREALAAARAAERRALRRVDLLLRYVPEHLGEEAEPPLRHRLADDLNRALRLFPGAHARLKRALHAARAAAGRFHVT